jgi:hypothetical protein
MVLERASHQLHKQDGSLETCTKKAALYMRLAAMGRVLSRRVESTGMTAHGKQAAE